MFENVWDKIKTCAKIIFIISMILSILLGMFTMIAGCSGNGGGEAFITGLFILIFGILGSFVSGFIIYGFGVLVEKAVEISENTKK